MRSFIKAVTGFYGVSDWAICGLGVVERSTPIEDAI